MRLIFVLLIALTVSGYFIGNSKPDTVKNIQYRRIVALAPSYCETMVALKESPRLVGVTTHCDLDEVKHLKRVGSFADSNLEIILSLKPDLVLAVPHPLALNNLRILRENGIEIFAHQPDSLRDIRDINEKLAEKLGIKERGLLLNRRLDQALEKAKAQVLSHRTTQPSALIAIAHSPLVVAGAHTFMAEIVEMMGFSNMATNPQTAWPIWPLENLISNPPDYFILMEGIDSVYSYQRLLRSLQLDLYNFGPALIVPKRPLFFSPSPVIIEDIEYFSNLLSRSA
ncbi:MAG: Vitamin B12-binding protein precursor [bacterium ADurb.BinA186]|nr:MAG: Vitamin B12-binding protein precursor [bacterium ADurb.BinA186]